MAEVYDPQRALTEDFRTFFVERKDDLFLLPCEQGPVELKGSWMLINLLITMPLIKRHRPINVDLHLHQSGIFNSKVHSQILTRISRTLEGYGYQREELGADMLASKSDIQNLNFTHIAGFARTIDIFSIARTILQPGVEEVCDPTDVYGDIDDGNIQRMENAFKERSAVIKQLFTDPNLPNNVFYAPLVCGALKEGQFFQFVFSAGPRTDTDDRLFLRPVFGSFLSGMRDEIDLAFESRSASKATHYNKSQMPITQYGNRKLHIQGSNIWHLYPGDCGTQAYMDYMPTKKTVERYLGKFYLSAENTLVELTRERFDEVIDKVVKFRDTIPCKYQDGYCEVCGGTITRSFSKLGNVGFLSNVNTGAPVAQQVLSTKHLISTNAAEYEVPSDLQRFLIADNNNIFLRPAYRNQKQILAIGFPERDIKRLSDLQYFNTGHDLQAAYFTQIKFLHTGLVLPDGSIDDKKSTRVPMGGDSKIYPHLSPEVLAVIRDYPDDLITQGNVTWLLLRNINADAPIMQCTVVNKSVKKFVDDFSNLITKQVERYSSANALMNDMMDLVYSRVSPHVTHLSCMVKAAAVTSKKDAHVPEITDPDNVMFGNLMRNIPMRSVGGLFAFERFNLASNKPHLYITPHYHGEYDEYMGYADLQERDAQWPVKSGSPLQIDDGRVLI